MYCSLNTKTLDLAQPGTFASPDGDIARHFDTRMHQFRRYFAIARA